MKIVDKGSHRELYPEEGKILKNSNGSLSRGTVILPGETEADYTEVTEEDVQEFLKQNEDGNTETN